MEFRGTIHPAVLPLAELGMSRKLSPVCPICEAQAVRLDPANFRGTAIRCPTHGEFAFSRSAEEGWPTRKAWETALKRAQHRTNPGRRPRIYATDF